MSPEIRDECFAQGRVDFCTLSEVYESTRISIGLLYNFRGGGGGSVGPLLGQSQHLCIGALKSHIKNKPAAAGCRRRPSPAEAPPIDKIHPYSKMAVSFELMMGF